MSMTDTAPAMISRKGKALLPSRLSVLDRNRLVETNLKLVDFILRQFGRGATAAGRDDLHQEGVVALMRAAELFDPGKGIQFATYASRAIRTRIAQAVARADTIHVPLRLEARERRELRFGLRPLPLTDNLNGPVQDAEPPPFECEEEAARRAALLREAVQDLPQPDRQVVEGYYLSAKRMCDIADDLGVTISRANQIRQRAVGRLRKLSAMRAFE